MITPDNAQAASVPLVRAAGSWQGSLLFLWFLRLQEPPCTPRSNAQPQNLQLPQLHGSLTFLNMQEQIIYTYL